MTVIVTCDYCGEPIETGDLYVTLNVRGHVPTTTNTIGWRSVNNDSGHYHTQPCEDEDGPACWWKVKDAVRLVEQCGPSLEQIPTISAQAVAARRRKHIRGEL